MRHLEGREDHILRVLLKAPSIAERSLDEDRRNVVPGIRVTVVRSRIEIERPLQRRHPQQVLVRQRVLALGIPAERRQSAPFADPAHMAQHLANRQRRAVVLQFRQILPHRIVQRNLPLLRQQDQRRRRKLLSHRSTLEHRIRRDRDIALEVRHAVPGGQHHRALLRNAHRASRRVRMECGKNLVDLGRMRTRGIHHRGANE